MTAKIYVVMRGYYDRNVTVIEKDAYDNNERPLCEVFLSKGEACNYVRNELARLSSDTRKGYAKLDEKSKELYGSFVTFWRKCGYLYDPNSLPSDEVLLEKDGFDYYCRNIYDQEEPTWFYIIEEHELKVEYDG